MKTLTHYFTSPKEDVVLETTSKVSSILCVNSCNSEALVGNAITKKRKLNLSKSNAKKNKINRDTLENETDVEHENQLNDSSSTNKKNRNNLDTLESETENENKLNGSRHISKKNKKRKIVVADVSEEHLGNSKKLKLDNKPKLSKLKLEKINSSKELLRTQEKSSKVDNYNRSTEIICFESSSNSSDEPLAKTKKKRNFVLESDDDSSSKLISESEVSKNSLVNPLIVEKNSSRSLSSLLGYFNKVDKETVQSKRTPEIIKVEAQVHIPPAERENPIRCSLSKLHKKRKKVKNKQLNNYDHIEVISSEDVPEQDKSTVIENLPKTESKEEAVKDLKEQTRIDNAKPVNIASIFMPKKKETKDAGSENLSSLKEELVTGDDLKTAQIKQRNSLKLKKSSENNNLKDEITDGNKCSKINVSHKEVKLKKSTKSGVINESKRNTNKSSSPPQLKDLKADINLSQTQELNEEDESNSIINEDRNENTPVKLKANETSKQKSHTINGYFTPKVNKDSCEKTEQSGSGRKDKKTPSSWVMKVRFSASKSVTGSDIDEDSTDSKIDENQKIVEETKVNGEKKGSKLCGSKEEDDNDIVVLDDDEESNSNDQVNRSVRKRLPRSAKTLKYSLEKKSEKSDEEDGSNSSQESHGTRRRISRSAKIQRCISEDKSEPTKQPVKMWPFFQKGRSNKSKDPPVDEEKLKAKLLFLESGVPEILKKKVDNEKGESVVGAAAPFPTVTHVTQADSVPTEQLSSNLPLPREQNISAPPPVPTWSTLVSVVDSDEPEIPVFNRPENVKAVLEKMKDEETKTEVKALYKCLKEYKKKAESDIWTEVYKPTKSADIVGNYENIKKLKTWLETFKNRRRRDGSESSGDEFINDESDEESSAVNNLAIISGPSGCGKTCVVYAIAAELDCKVLEINASCNRSGKRILAEFSESTQSHQVERSQPINGLFNNQSSGKSKKKKKKLKKTKEAKSEKTSLILVEDADLLFTDADEGYLQALSSLAATAKRPIILVTNQTRNPHLDRFQSNRPLHLTFSKPKASKIELWLRLVGLVEGMEVTTDLAECLVAWSGCDIRRALLQLQLMVQSNNSELKRRQTERELWWQWPMCRGLQFELPTLLESEEPPPPPQVDKVQLMKELEEVSHTTSRLAYLDVFSARCSYQLQMLNNQADPCLTPWAAQCSDSTAQTPCLLDPVNSTSTELADWLAESVSRGDNKLKDSERHGGQTAHEARWLSILRQSEQMFLSGVSSSVLSNHLAVACEYMPTLRDMGRAEQVRLTNYSRRANRFFNYLQGLGIHTSKSFRDFMCDAFS